MISNTTERARLLMEQRRYKEAEKELQRNLSSDPNNTDTLCLLSICKSEDKKYEEAEKLIKIAISLDPAYPYLIYVYAKILLDQDKNREAEKNIREAIHLEPHNADYFGLLAAIYLNQKEWDKALEFANKGLEISPDNLSCLNIRSTALLKLNKKEESYTTISEALNYDPENAITHTNLGWGLLEKGEHQKALVHFKKALQINPESDFAKHGMVEALKARYFIYSLFLKYAFWIGNMKGKAQWGILLGFYVGSRVLKSIAASNPTLKPFIMPVVFLYILFAISTWIIAPLSNLFLRLNVYGRYALSRTEIITSNFVGISLVIGLTAFITYLFLPEELFFMVGIFGLSMMIPLASMLGPEGKKGRLILIGYTSALGLVGVAALVLTLMGNSSGESLGILYLVGIMLYQWVANAVMTR
jgi:tetratricopeptide (TPR) repeat protein